MKELFDHLKITARAGNALIATLLGLKLLSMTSYPFHFKMFSSFSLDEILAHRMDVLELTDSSRLFLLKDSPFDWLDSWSQYY